MRGPALVIGIGNADRGDDAVGLCVVRRLAGWALPGVVVEEAGGDALALIERWNGMRHVVLVDASEPAGAPGRIRRLDATAVALPRDVGLSSTHAFGLVEAVELARTLGCLPEWRVVYAIEAGGLTAGAGLAPAVAASVEPAASRIAAELAAAQAAGEEAGHA